MILWHYLVALSDDLFESSSLETVVNEGELKDTHSRQIARRISNMSSIWELQPRADVLPVFLL
jgi:hypothetical protein